MQRTKRKQKPAEPDRAATDPVRLRIVAGASRYFFTNGFRRASMDDMVAELGMSKKTVYAHFDSKMQLLDAVIENKFRRVRTDMEAVLAARCDYPETLRRHLDCMQHHTAEIQPPFIRDMRLDGQEIFQKVEQHRRVIIRTFFGELMRRGRRDGFIRSDIPPQVIIEILLAAMQAIVNPARLEELGLTPKTACAIITKVVLEGAIDPASKTQFNRSGRK